MHITKSRVHALYWRVSESRTAASNMAHRGGWNLGAPRRKKGEPRQRPTDSCTDSCTVSCTVSSTVQGPTSDSTLLPKKQHKKRAACLVFGFTGTEFHGLQCADRALGAAAEADETQPTTVADVLRSALLRSGAITESNLWPLVRTKCARHAHVVPIPCPRRAHSVPTPCPRRAHAVPTPRTHRAHAAHTPCACRAWPWYGLGSCCRPAEPALALPSQVDTGEPHRQGRARSGRRRVVSNGNSR